MDQFSSRTSKDVNVKNDINKFPEEEDDLGDSIEDGVNGKQGLDSQIGLEGLNMLTARDVFKMKFDSEENAHAFYNAYAKVMGFSIRKDRKKVRRENVVVSRKWVCSRQGVRAKKYLERVDRLRAPRAETRVGCKAIFRVRYDVKMGEYIVTHFVSEHNHPLVAPHCVPFLWSHRSVTNVDKAQTKAMRNVGISTGQIMDLMTIQSGGFDKDMNKFKADVKEMRKALLHCENDSSTNESEDGAKSEDATGSKNEAESDDGTGKEEDGTEGESGNDSEDSDNNEDGDE